MKNIVKIVFVIIATLVGAGFASGKEIFTFFFVYGKLGCVGILISSLIISLVIYKVFKICNKNKIDTYQQFCNHIGNPNKINNAKFAVANNTKFANLLNNIVNIFLLITFYVMIAGFSSLLKQEFGINGICRKHDNNIIMLFCFSKGCKWVN